MQVVLLENILLGDGTGRRRRFTWPNQKAEEIIHSEMWEKKMSYIFMSYKPILSDYMFEEPSDTLYANLEAGL